MFASCHIVSTNRYAVRVVLVQVKDGIDVEEALRLKALAAMASKKGQRDQEEN